MSDRDEEIPPNPRPQNASDEGTLLTHSGRDAAAHAGAVNPAVYRASTILFPTVEKFHARSSQRVRYGTHGTPTAHALEDAISELEGAAGTVLAPSGLAAISLVLLTYLRPGSHLLLPDSVYGPVRKLAVGLIKEMGVSTTFYPPRIGADIAGLMTPATAMVWMESPGSLTFEIQDVPALAAAAQKAGAITVLDNSWAGGLYFKPIHHGIDISLQAATKYIVGHSDVLMGTVACNDKTFDKVTAAGSMLGICVGADDAYLALRGLRTLQVRMDRQYQSGLAVARFLESHPQVLHVAHPGLPSHPDHQLWKRDFTGASGLFGFTLSKPDNDIAKRLSNMLDHMKLFGMGASWGGYESLLVPAYPEKLRTATSVPDEGFMMRIHVGLETPDDLIADLAQALDRWSAN